MRRYWLLCYFCLLFLFSSTEILASNNGPNKNKFKYRVFPDSLKDSYPKTYSHSFYDSLRQKTNSNKFLSTLIALALKKQQPNRKVLKSHQFVESQIQFLAYNNKTIRNITIFPKQVFTQNSSWQFINYVKKKLNHFHVKTKESVIRRNLFFKEGDKLIPIVLAENKRRFSEFEFFNDIKFEIVPVLKDSIITDSVDIKIITQDVFSFGGGISFPGNNSIDLRGENVNFLGTGTKISGTIEINSKSEEEIKFIQGILDCPNILNSYYEGNLFYNLTNNSKLYKFTVSKNLLPPIINVSGGLELGRKFICKQTKDSTLVIPKSIHNFMKIGFGKTNPINKNKHYAKRSYLTYLTSVYAKKYTQRPEIKADSNRYYHNRFGLLGSVIFSHSQHYLTSKVFTFDKIEYMPSGFLFELMTGPEFNEFYNRFYYGSRLANADFIKNFGYYWSKIEIGSFFRKGKAEQGVFQARLQYCSPILEFGNKENRTLLNLRYTRGINRNREELLNINGENGIRGFTDNDLFGNQRLTLNLESIVFTPWDFYGFHFAVFTFYDAGFIGDDINIINNKFESGIGLGLRIRNNFLAISFIQLRLGYYPQKNSFSFSVGGENLPNLEFFNISYPTIISFI